MAWLNSITDRTLADIQNRAAKAFFNVADWNRINGNTAEVQAQILSLLGVNVALITLTAPTTTTFPSAASINQLVENIERLRVAACLPSATGIVPLKYDYQAGAGAEAPDYQAVNAWEQALNLMHNLLPQAADYFVSCGVAAAGQARFWQARFRG